jgi:hypothetical protein
MRLPLLLLLAAAACGPTTTTAEPAAPTGSSTTVVGTLEALDAESEGVCFASWTDDAGAEVLMQAALEVCEQDASGLVGQRVRLEIGPCADRTLEAGLCGAGDELVIGVTTAS